MSDELESAPLAKSLTEGGMVAMSLYTIPGSGEPPSGEVNREYLMFRRYLESRMKELGVDGYVKFESSTYRYDKLTIYATITLGKEEKGGNHRRRVKKDDAKGPE